LGFESLARSNSRSGFAAAFPSEQQANMRSVTDKAERDERIRALLAGGWKPSEISRELGISLSVVSRTALRLGYRSRTGPPRTFDWVEIRRYYEAGHTARECRERFGFSRGAWDSAVSRGEIVRRPGRDPARIEHTTRNEVERLYAQGLKPVEIARELGLAKGTVAYHVRNLGVEPDARFSRRYDWAVIQEAYDGGLTVSECCEQFGFCRASWSQAVARGDIVPRPRALPLEELLVNGKKRGRYNLKRRLIEAGLKENRCERCGINSWRGVPLNLEIHHRNGDKFDNRLEALEILCPNCHSQTENFGRLNASHPRR
jgi:hypothetical protein